MGANAHLSLLVAFLCIWMTPIWMPLEACSDVIAAALPAATQPCFGSFSSIATSRVLVATGSHRCVRQLRRRRLLLASIAGTADTFGTLGTVGTVGTRHMQQLATSMVRVVMHTSCDNEQYRAQHARGLATLPKTRSKLGTWCDVTNCSQCAMASHAETCRQT